MIVVNNSVLSFENLLKKESKLGLEVFHIRAIKLLC